MKTVIAIAGTGYVGMSMATLLSQHNKVYAVDISKEKVDKINRKESPIKDELIEQFLKEKDLDLTATLDSDYAYKNADFIIISTPTNYDVEKNYFDTSSIESVIENVLSVNDKCYIIIKSTIPIGYTDAIRYKYNTNRILFSPEFLREGKALEDNLYPSRIIVGRDSSIIENNEKANEFADLLKNASIKKPQILFMGLKEAESVKLFANSYLALRISYFNELDTYAESNNLNTKEIINGICSDVRIGDYYNNPSFGYGGYCLPKDSKQLLANYKDIPQSIISSIVESNRLRKKYIVDKILSKISKESTVGIYKLTMKSNSDNFRCSAIHDIINNLLSNNIKVIVYEPLLKEYKGLSTKIKIVNDIDKFKKISNIILANRIDVNLINVREKVYTRDIFSRD